MLISVEHVAMQETAASLECEVAALQVSLAAEQGQSAQLTALLEKACAKAHLHEAALKEAERYWLVPLTLVTVQLLQTQS